MISKYSFTCNTCQKHFEVKGHWYNQILMEWWLDFKWICHCIIRHHKKLNRKEIILCVKMVIIFPVLLALQVLDIAVTPFRNL